MRSGETLESEYTGVGERNVLDNDLKSLIEQTAYLIEISREVVEHSRTWREHIAEER